MCSWSDAHSAEFDSATAHPVIDLMPDQVGVTAKGRHHAAGQVPLCAGGGHQGAGGLWPERDLGTPPPPLRVQQRVPPGAGGGGAARRRYVPWMAVWWRWWSCRSTRGTWAASSTRSSRAVPTAPTPCSAASSPPHWSNNDKKGAAHGRLFLVRTDPVGDGVLSGAQRNKCPWGTMSRFARFLFCFGRGGRPCPPWMTAAPS